MRKLIAVLTAFLILVPVAAQAQTSSTCNLEVVLLVDSSGSITPEYFERIKTFAAGIANILPLGGENVRVGVVQFSAEAIPMIGLSTDSGAIGGAIGSMSLLGGASNFVSALDAGQAILMAESRPYVTRTLVLITDGLSIGEPQNVAQDIRDTAVIFAVGIGGGPAPRELFNLASPHYYANTVYMTRFDELGYTIGGLRDGLCNAPAVISGTVQTLQRNERGRLRYGRAEGVVVNLYDEHLNFVRSTTTDVRGIYRFYITGGTYHIRVELPAGAFFPPPYNGEIGPITVRPGTRNSTSSFTTIQLADATPAPGG